MRSRIRVLYGVPLALTLAAAPAEAGVWRTEISLVRDIDPNGASFTQQLAKGYKAFALNEGHVMGDWIDGNYFATKALMADAGETVAAEHPDRRDLPAAHRAALEEAYAELNAALDKGAWKRFPDLAASAQVNYDCWIEQQEEAHQPGDIAECRAAFEDAMARLAEAMQPPPPVAAAAPVAEPEPKLKLELGAEIAREVVYFDWDRDAIRPEAQAKIDAFAERMRQMEDIILVVVGHADRSGTDSYNEGLSQRRAEYVRAELLRQGLPVAALNQFRVEAKGEREPAVATADGVREQANRRVEISAHGMVHKLVQIYVMPKTRVSMVQQ